MGILSNFFTILFSPGWEIHSRRVRCYRCWRFEAVQVSLAATDRGFFIDRAALPKKNARRLSNGGHSESVERFLGSSNGNKYTVTLLTSGLSLSV